MTDSYWRFSNKNQQTASQIMGAYTLHHSEMRRDAIEQDLGIDYSPEHRAIMY